MVVRGQSPSPLTGMFFFFLRIFLRPGIMFVSLFVCMFVPLFKRCGWGARAVRCLFVIFVLKPL